MALADLLANWNENFFGWNAANFGWGGDGIEHMHWRIEDGELEGVNPRVIVILAGSNNVGRNPGDDHKLADIIAGYRALIAACRRRAPDATLVVTAIFPRNDNPAVLPEILRINDALHAIADGSSVSKRQ